MPTYTYRCNDCSTEFERRQRFSEAPLEQCPVCGGVPRRVVSAVGVVFKGSGFYVTDNRSGHNAAQRPKLNGAAAENDKKTATSSEGDSTPSTPPTSKVETTT